ncbi:MAG: transposase [Deltaproteobacteria bacterium]|jgi:SRSO17 transposase|nr:transposase [Deltaproteobacteria bacterium]
MANLMTRGLFDDEGMLGEYQRESAKGLSAQGGMITVDGCDFPKKGNNSVGVSRQHSGRLGKVEKCQASVMVGHASQKGNGTFDYQLCMTKKWSEVGYLPLRERCKVPGNLEHQSKNEMLPAMLNKVHASKALDFKYVGVDSAFGSDTGFLGSMPEGVVYFANVRHDHLLFEGRPEIIDPGYKGRGRKRDPAPSFGPRNAGQIPMQHLPLLSHWHMLTHGLASSSGSDDGAKEFILSSSL